MAASSLLCAMRPRGHSQNLTSSAAAAKTSPGPIRQGNEPRPGRAVSNAQAAIRRISQPVAEKRGAPRAETCLAPRGAVASSSVGP